jgi:YggT family protein
VFILCVAITLFLVVLTARAVLSWFPNQPGGVLEQIQSVLNTLTEPVLRPVRQVIPPAGMFDLSFLVVFFGLFLLRQIICG